MKRIVVGYDASPQASDALRLGADLATATGAELTVAVVAEIGPSIGIGSIDSEWEERGAYYQEVLGQATAELGERPYERRAAAGSVPWALGDIAQDAHADVLVVGSTHRAKLGQVLPGSVGDRLLAGTPCAVAITPRGYATRPPNPLARIGIGFDGQHESWAALRLAIQLAEENAAELRVIAVTPPPRLLPNRGGMMASTDYARILHDYLTDRLADAMATVPDDVSATSVLREGDPADELADEGAGLDLLVIGSRGYGPIRRVLLGGVAHELIKGASCPLLITPRSAAQPQPDTHERSAAAAT